MESLRLEDLIKSDINLIQFTTFENVIVLSEVDRAVKVLGNDWKWVEWDLLRGPIHYNKENCCFQSFVNPKEKDPENNPTGWEEISMLLESFVKEDFFSKTILILNDIDLVCYPNGNDSPNYSIIFKNFYFNKDVKDRAIVIVQHTNRLPSVLSKIVYRYELPYADYEILFEILLASLEDKGYKNKNGFTKKELKNNTIVENLVKGCTGLTITEAESVFKKIITYKEKNSGKSKKSWKFENTDINYVLKEKEMIIKNSGYLEYYPSNETLKDVGGLKKLINWFEVRGKAFTKEAEEFGLPKPRGVLLLGIPGTGKSLCAKAIGATWQFPVIRLDMGKIFAGLVGESESNMRNALRLVEAVAPCVVWIDEIEKGLSGLQSSGATDGGTTSRVLGTFLTWMQEKKSSVFVVATANDISNLPPELLRKGRVDEIFFVDLPVKKEREDIIRIHLSKFKRNPENFDISNIAEATRSFSGAEIEETIKDALYEAFNEGAKDITTEHIINSAKKTYPISKTMKEKIASMRSWAKKRAVLASEIENTEDEFSTIDDPNNIKAVIKIVKDI